MLPRIYTIIKWVPFIQNQQEVYCCKRLIFGLVSIIDLPVRYRKRAPCPTISYHASCEISFKVDIQRFQVRGNHCSFLQSGAQYLMLFHQTEGHLQSYRHPLFFHHRDNFSWKDSICFAFQDGHPSTLEGNGQSVERTKHARKICQGDCKVWGFETPKQADRSHKVRMLELREKSPSSCPWCLLLW